MHQHGTFGCVARRLEGLGDPPEEGTVALEALSCCPDGVWESTTRPWEPGPRLQQKGGNRWTAGCTSQVSAPEGLSLTSGLDTLPPPPRPLGACVIPIPAEGGGGGLCSLACRQCQRDHLIQSAGTTGPKIKPLE